MIKECEFPIFNNNEIYEICIGIGDEKFVKNVKFQLEFYFFVAPSFFSEIKYFLQSFYKPPENQEENKNDENFEPLNYKNGITYKLFPKKIKFKDLNGKKYLFATYYFTAMKKTNCIFYLKSYGRSRKNLYFAKRIQVFTLTKKFVCGYINTWTDEISLLPGKYIVKGLFEYSDDKILQKLLPFTAFLPVITLTVNLNEINVFKTFWTNSLDEIRKYSNSYKAYVGSYLPFSSNIEKYVNNINENDSKLWLNILQKYYNNFETENIKKVADLFLQKSKAKQFLQNYEKMENNAYFYEKELIKIRKSIILDILFYKTDAILNEYLKNNENIPIIFKANFDFANFESKMKNESIFDILWSIFTYNFYPKSLQKPKNICPKLLNENVNFEQKNENINIQPNLKSKNRKSVKNVTSLFLKFAEESDIRKTFILIKNALIFGNFGTALFYLNKISTENQTISNYKIFDEIIIQILKQLGWKHLIEAHENALLDRHRNYFRMF